MRLMVLLTVGIGVVTVLMAGNPWHLRHFAPIFVVLVAATTVSATVTALLLPARRVVRRAVAGACAAIGVAVTAILGFGAVAFHSPGQAAMRVVSGDGRYELLWKLPGVLPPYPLLPRRVIRWGHAVAGVSSD